MQALVIDDNAMNLSVIGSLLTSMNIDHVPVLDTTALPEAIDQLHRVDLVLLDLALNNTDGYEVFDTLRNTYGVTAPIVACTVHANEINNARRYGFHSFLTKPLETQRFQQSVRRILKNIPVWETE